MNQHSLDSATLLKSDLYHIKNIFLDSELEYVLTSLPTQTNWQTVNLQEMQPRHTLQWESDGLVDYTWELINHLDFSKFGLKFTNVSIWRDQHPYCICNHVDNDQVKAAMQIYLSTGMSNTSTWFDTIEIPFELNTGYIMNNRNKLPHKMKHPVPLNQTRYSVYALFDYV
jgi:hypothetical protein